MAFMDFGAGLKGITEHSRRFKRMGVANKVGHSLGLRSGFM